MQSEDNFTFKGQLLYSTKLALLAHLIRVNDWGHFKLLWNIFYNKIDMLLYQPILNNLSDLLEWVIDPVYRKVSFSRFFKSDRVTCKEFKIEEVKTR